MSDPYFDMVREHWGYILNLYRVFEDKKPVMLYDIQEQKIYAYPYQDFKADLSERSRALLEEQYERALLANNMVVFVRDNEERKLVSYSLSIEES